MTVAETQVQMSIPSGIDSTVMVTLVASIIDEVENSVLFKILKTISAEDNKEISGWLGMTEKTFRSYKSKDKEVSLMLAERVVTLISLFKHGIDVFGDVERFKEWLKTKNFLLGDKEPIEYFNTISGMQFVDDRLTGIEYGDNV